AMRENLARCLDIDINQVGVKATSTEGMGYEGRQEGISAQAIALLNDISK
ncbi:MAG: 2-C-methyl-D-erythritol 2,4-cyclodiphosphate synthase, partial [Syntrophomonadaceae bacterium]|nr:2-C-methyl-D-erythritol 2,4-cyclodiphosphate synthase [Syntrophomonadaceae bacterium]